MMWLIERSRIYAEKIAEYTYPPRRDTYVLQIQEAFVTGAMSEISPFRYWNRPEEQLPANSKRVLVRVMLPNGEDLVTGGWYGTAPGEQGWNIDISDRFPDLKVVSWRSIMSIEMETYQE